MTDTGTVVAGAKATFAGRIVYALSNAALLYVLTGYLLTPGEYGLLYTALAVLGVGTLLAGTGIPKAGARYVTEFLETAGDQVRPVLHRALAFRLLAATLAAVGLVAVHGTVARLVGEPALAPLLVVGGGYLLAHALMGFPRMMFQALNSVQWSALVRAIEGVSRFAFAVTLVALGYGPRGALVGFVLALAVAGFVGLVLFYRRYYVTLPPAGEPEPGLTRRLLEYSVPVSVVRGADVLDSKVDTVLVSALVGVTGAGFYTLARQIAMFVTMPVQSLGFALAPALGDQGASDRHEEAARLYERSVGNALLLYLPGALGLALIARPLVVHIFGTQYAGAVPVLQVLCIFLVVFAVNTLTSNSLDYLGLASMRARARGVTAAMNVGLNLALIPPLGVPGAAIATVLTYSLYTVANVYVIASRLPLDPGWLTRQLLKVAGVTLGVGAAVVLVMPFVTGLPALAAVVTAGVVTWASLSVLTGLVDPRTVSEQLL
jgi:O-antigen/teichoic acid export membrane protein